MGLLLLAIVIVIATLAAVVAASYWIDRDADRRDLEGS